MEDENTFIIDKKKKNQVEKKKKHRDFNGFQLPTNI